MLDEASSIFPRKSTLSSQVTRYLLDLIAREHLGPGDLVPSEVRICRELNVSRGIVREAYRSLAALGVLEIESGKSPRVQQLNSAVLTQFVGLALRTARVDVPQVIQVRRALEIEAARKAALHGTSAQFSVLKECLVSMREAGGDHLRMIAADIRLHRTIADATHNPLFTLLIDGLHGSLEDSMELGLKSRRSRDELLRVPEVHETLVERVAMRDSDGAAEAMALHFDLSAEAILRAGVEVAARGRSQRAGGRDGGTR